MQEEKSEILFPEENEHRLKEELFWKLNRVIRFTGFEDKKKTIWLIAIIIKAFIVVSIVTFAYKVRNEPDKLAVCMATCPTILMAVLKLFHMHFDSKRVKYLLNSISEDFWDLGVAGPRMKDQLTRRFFLINLLLANQILIGLGCVYFLNMFPLMEATEGSKRLPNAVWLPFDTDPSPLYEFLYLLLVWNQIFTVLGNGFFDFTYCCAVQQLCAQLLLLKELLKNVTVGVMPYDSDLGKFNSKYFQRQILERLKICFKHHSKLLKYGKNLDQFSSRILLPQLIMSYMVMVVNGYILTSHRPPFFQSVEMCSFTLLIFSEFVLIALQASELNGQSVSVMKAVILSEWYLFKAPIKKTLVFLMMNTKNGMVITAGGMVEVNNALIIEIIHKVFSAIALLKALVMEAELSRQ